MDAIKLKPSNRRRIPLPENRRQVGRTAIAAAAVTVACAALTSCDGNGAALGTNGETAAPTTTTSQQAAPTTGQTEAAEVDYSRLLLQPGDLSDEENSYVLRSTAAPQNEVPGASALFVNTDDTRAVSDTIAVYPDAATATATLRQAVAQADTVIAGGTPQSVPVGTDGTMIVGNSGDGTKSATLLLFTEGPALVRLQFESALGDVTADRYVLSVGKMQQVALRVGLPTNG